MIAFAALIRLAVASARITTLRPVIHARVQRLGVVAARITHASPVALARFRRASLVAFARLTAIELDVSAYDTPSLDFSQPSNSMYLGLI